MTPFNLVRHRNGDFILSAGSRIPVAGAIGGGGGVAQAHSDSCHPADLLIRAGDGMPVDVA